MATTNKEKARAARSQNFRIKLVDRIGNISFITRKGGRVSYFSANETPLALSNAAGNNAAQLRFALEDCYSGGDALVHIRKLAPYTDPNKTEVL